MLSSASFAAAFSIFTLSFAAPIPNVATRGVVARNAYVMFGGDGTVATGWPSQKSWMSFDDAWESNLKTIQTSCESNGWGANNSDAETQAIKDSIIEESKTSGVPKELILAVVVQESKGCVRAPTTRWGHENPGLMQSAQGKGTCNPDGNPISPCPASTIRLMIHEGTNGDGLGTTLKQCITDAGATDDSKWYKAARIYNAGRVTDNNLGIGPTPCYASDIANRLMSAFGSSTCDSAVIGTLASAQGAIAELKPTPEEAKPVVETPAAYTPPPPPTNAAAGNVDNSEPATGSAKPDLIVDGAATGCTKYYTPLAGDSCASAPVDFDTLCKLNTQLDSACSNLWAGYAYCIAV